MSDSDFFKKLSLPVIAAPMFLVSGTKLVIEACKNNIVGSFPALNQRTTEGFEKWIIEIKNALDKSKGNAVYGVNLIVNKSNKRLKADLEICIKHKVPLIITSLGIDETLIKEIHSYGGLVYHDVTNTYHAQKAIASNVDGLILVSNGAGGHGGTINPIALVGEIRKIFDKKIILSGCITTGQDIATALQMGADMVYMGTRFINTEESLASESYKQMVIEATTDDIIYTDAISGVNANFLKESLKKSGVLEAILENKEIKEEFLKNEELKPWLTIWSAGQGVTTIDNVLTVKELVDQLKRDFLEAIQNQVEVLARYK